MSALVASYGEVEMRRRFDEDEEDTDGSSFGFDDNEDDEDLEDDERGDGVSRKSENVRAPRVCVQRRLARLDGHAVEENLGAEGLQAGGHVIEVTFRDTTSQEQDIAGFEAGRDGLLQRGARVGDRSARVRAEAALPQLRRRAGRARFELLARAQAAARAGRAGARGRLHRRGARR